MDYYKQRRMVMQDIRVLAEKGSDLEDIKFFILEKYGFSEKFVEKFYTLLEERGFVKSKKK